MPLRWSKIRESGGSGRMILLSGLRYPTDRPMFGPAQEAAKKRGMGVTSVDFTFADDPDFVGKSDREQFALIEEEGRALVEALGAGPFVLVGKSIGTLVMGAMVGRVEPRTRWVWLTPALKGTGLLEKISACPGPSLSVIGGRDGSVDITRSNDYLSLPGMTHLEFEGFNHVWAHPRGAVEEGRSLVEIGRVLDRWLDETATV